jgi:hypothetical protein
MMGLAAKPNPVVPQLKLVDAPPAGDAPLSAEHLAQLREAERRARKLRRAAGVAGFGGWSAAIFAAASAALSLTDPVGLTIAGVLALVAYHEFRGRGQLLRIDPGAPRRLALNQVFLGAALVGYGGWKLYGVLTGRSELLQQTPTGDPQTDAMMRDVMQDMGGLVRTAMVAVYSGVIAVGVLVPGLTAVYYWSRRRVLADFLRTTPPWVVELMRARA